MPFARRIVETFPDRVLWGTDWPHPNLKNHMPDDGWLVDYLPRVAVTPALQQKLLVDNPVRLYWEQLAPIADRSLETIHGPRQTLQRRARARAVFDADQARRGYHLNQFCMSLDEGRQPRTLQGR